MYTNLVHWPTLQFFCRVSQVFRSLAHLLTIFPNLKCFLFHPLGLTHVFFTNAQLETPHKRTQNKSIR